MRGDRMRANSGYALGGNLRGNSNGRSEQLALLALLSGGWRVVDEHHVEREYRRSDFREALDRPSRRVYDRGLFQKARHATSVQPHELPPQSHRLHRMRRVPVGPHIVRQVIRTGQPASAE
jgi:hypothetical protein